MMGHWARRCIMHLSFWLFTVAMGVLLSGAAAQDYPTRAITIVVPFPPGGPTDTLARLFAEPMKVTLGQTVVVENVSGAGGNVGVGRVARAAPDGYTIGIGQTSTHIYNAAVYS